MADWTFEQVAGPYPISEGPAWDGGGLLFTEIANSRILRLDPATGACDEVRTGTNAANGLMFDQQGLLYACEGGGRRIVRYEPDGGTTVIADRYQGRRLNSPNDLAIDSLGRIWFTDPRYGDNRSDMELIHESVFRLDPPTESGGLWDITRVTFDTTRPNGLLVSHDDRSLYVAQSSYVPSEPRELRAYPINDDGTLGEYTVVHSFGPHRGIDGMCLDTEGNIIATSGWEVSGPGPMINVFSPTGRVLETHPVPRGRPTNCTFGGPDLRTLYVTTIEGPVYRTETTRTGHLWWPRPVE